MKILIEDKNNDIFVFAGLEPSGNISLRIGDEIAELDPKQWNKIVSFIEREAFEKEEEERLSKSWIRRFV